MIKKGKCYGNLNDVNQTKDPLAVFEARGHRLGDGRRLSQRYRRTDRLYERQQSVSVLYDPVKCRDRAGLRCGRDTADQK